jgi:hypothetical protein
MSDMQAPTVKIKIKRKKEKKQRSERETFRGNTGKPRSTYRQPVRGIIVL